MTLLLISVILIALSVLLMAIKLIIKNQSSFPSGHVGDVPELRRRGIDCHSAQFYEEEHHQTLADRLSDTN